MSLSGNLTIPLRRIHPYLSFALLGTNPMGRRSPSFMEGLPSESTTTTSSSSIIITTMYCYCFCYVSHCITNNAVIFYTSSKMWCVILYNHYLYSIFYHCHLSVSFTRVSCHLLLSDSVRCLYCKASMIVGDITINHPLFIIHSSSINHPFIIHSSSIHHSLIIQSSSIHHLFIIH